MGRDFQTDNKSRQSGIAATHVTRADEHRSETVPPIVHEVLRSPGEPLDTATRDSFERRFGHDFSRVRVHRDAEAAESAGVLNARAYTAGNDIVFGRHQYAPATNEGESLLGHELSHVVQSSGRHRSHHMALPPEIVNERPLTLSDRRIYRQPASAPASTQARQDVAIIVGRPSMSLEKDEKPEEKMQMELWRSAAIALTPTVYEGLTVDTAFAGLKNARFPIGKLYIIAHADVSGIGEIRPDGSSVSTTVEDLTKRIKAATGELGSRSPQSVEMLSCFGGGSPKTMGKIGKTVGTSTVRAPVSMTVISGRVLSLRSGGKTVTLTKEKLQRESNETLITYIRQLDILKYYDFVPGVPHPKENPPEKEKLNAMVAVLKKTGRIPFVSYNAEPGQRHAVAYWKAPIERRKATDKDLSDAEVLQNKGVIEVVVEERKERGDAP